MEVDVIILPKDGGKDKIQLGMKRAIINCFNELYDNVNDESIQFDLDGQIVTVQYQLATKNANMVFAKFKCEYTTVRAARVLDCCINKLIEGKHRKDWNIVITYNEVSQLYCCKLMPYFGIFERRTRELVYITVIKIFGVEWYDKSFSESMQCALKGKGNKSKLIEGALDELTYEQLKEYLFLPFSNKNISEILDGELSKEHIEKLSKEDIITMIDACRKVSLWDRFFGKYERFNNFKEKIDELQLYRNTVMHHKKITLQEYKKVKKSLKAVNKLLLEAIKVLEEEIYTETRLVDVVSALGNTISNILGNSVPKWLEQMKPSLASLGKFLIEAAMPQINVPDIMPKLILGSDLSRHFESVYRIQQMENSANAIDNAIYASQEMKVVNEMARKFSRIKDISENASSHAIELVAATLDNSSSYLASKIVAQANSINTMCDIPTYERIIETTKGINSYGIRYLDGLKLEQAMDEDDLT